MNEKINVYEEYTAMVKKMAVNLILHGMNRADGEELVTNVVKEVFDNKDIVLDTLRELIDSMNSKYNDGSGKFAIYRVSFNPESIMYPSDPVYTEAIKNANGDPVVVIDFNQTVHAPVKMKKKEFNPIVRSRRYILVDIDRCYKEEDRVDIIARINHILNPTEFPAVEERKSDESKNETKPFMTNPINILPVSNERSSVEDE